MKTLKTLLELYVEFYVEFTKTTNQGSSQGCRNVLFVLHKLIKPFYGKPSVFFFFIYETQNKVEFGAQLMLKLILTKRPNGSGLFVGFGLFFRVVQVTVGCAIFLLARAWITAMGGRPSDDRASNFSADISLLGLIPYALQTRTDSFFGKLYIQECSHTIHLASGH